MKRPLHARTQVQLKKMIRREEGLKTRMSEFVTGSQGGGKDIWDVEYMTTSDEEDNDSEPEEKLEEPSDSQQWPNQVEAQAKKRQQKPDVIRTLLERDEDLQTRDLHARLQKIKFWKIHRKRVLGPQVPGEEYDLNEDFTWITPENEGDIYYAMGTKFKTVYRKGEQLFNCYGLRTNRFLLLNYGFCLRNNKYNSLGFKVFVNSPQKKEVSEEGDESRFQKIIRLKREKLCEDLLQYLRANLIFSYKGSNKEILLVSSPVDIDFELFTVSCALNLMKNMMNSKYPTTLEQDKKMLA